MREDVQELILKYLEVVKDLDASIDEMMNSEEFVDHREIWVYLLQSKKKIIKDVIFDLEAIELKQKLKDS